MIELSLQDPLMPHLMDIVSRPEAAGAILSGGFGLRLKQAQLRAQGAQMLIAELPDARATQDFDFFLDLQLWLSDRAGAIAFRTMLEELGYSPEAHSWKFSKEFDLGHKVKLDMQARTPLEEEPIKVSRRPNKVPQVGKGMNTGIAGFETPEGFAIENSPLTIALRHEGRRAMVRVPHPYAWLNLKTKAAHDWLREDRGEIPARPVRESDLSTRLKHVFDVYLLTAMLTEGELQEAEQIALDYTQHPLAQSIKEMAKELYEKPDSPGMAAIDLYSRRSFRRAFSIDHKLFFNDGLRSALGL